MSGYRPANNGNRTANRIGATVSRKLRQAGFNVSPSARKHRYNGMFVSAMGDLVSVYLDFGIESKNQRVGRQLLAEVLEWAGASDISAEAEGVTVTLYFTYNG